MKKLLLLMLLLGFQTTVFAQSPGSYNVWCIGHSDCRVQNRYAGRDFPGVTWEIRNYDSEPCSYILEFLPLILTQLQSQYGTPDKIENWLGDTDAEHGTNVTDFMSCTRQVVALELAVAPVVLPNVLPVPVYDPNNGNSFVIQYNQAEAAELWPIGVTTVDVWTPTVVHMGPWSYTANLQYWTYPQADPNSLGWSVIDGVIAPVLEK